MAGHSAFRMAVSYVRGETHPHWGQRAEATSRPLPGPGAATLPFILAS